MDWVQRHGSGKHHAVVEGINLITLLWTDGDRHVPAAMFENGLLDNYLLLQTVAIKAAAASKVSSRA